LLCVALTGLFYVFFGRRRECEMLYTSIIPMIFALALDMEYILYVLARSQLDDSSPGITL
jgi:hypothetical protein